MITKYFIQKKIDKIAPFLQKNDEKPFLDQIQSIVILCNALDLRHVRKAKFSLNKKHKKQVFLWGINRSPITLGYSQATILDHTDINFWGFPKPSFIEEFKKIEADVLIDLSREYSPTMTYIMLHNDKIKHKIGFRGHNPQYYDLICNTHKDEHIEVLYKEVIKFLT